MLGDDIVDRRRRPARARLGLGRTSRRRRCSPSSRSARRSRWRSRREAHRAARHRAVLPALDRRERARRAEADELIDFLGLGRYADTYIADLSTGTRRIVELAGLLALDARVLCLDEPTAGLAQRETEAFGPLIGDPPRARRLDDLIEHDMPLIMAISDRVYCLEIGR